jgi:hypothetical protein
VFSFRVLVKKQKTRDCFGNRGFLKFFDRLEFSSHAASVTGNARPNGVAAIGGRVHLQLFGEQGLHS